MAIWKRLKKSTPEQEEEFSEIMTEEKVGFKDKMAMIVSAFFVLVVPSALVLIILSVIVLALFGQLW
ncbi:MAG: hypothetical protein E7334_04925 [Clostridiales bacterium]|nr:hypothetical protein [Clostridiales bacterium]